MMSNYESSLNALPLLRHLRPRLDSKGNVRGGAQKKRKRSIFHALAKLWDDVPEAVKLAGVAHWSAVCRFEKR